MNFFSDSLTFSMDFVFVYIYDESGTPMAIRYASITSMSSELWHTLYLEKNMFGDVVAIYDEYGNKCISYTYDAWGNHTTTYHAGTTSQSIEAYNPFRYRGYYYDDETGLYYLNSRYYDPELGRFISADGYISTGQGILGNNMFAYCGNNPVNRADYTGLFWKEIESFFENVGSTIQSGVEKFFKAALGSFQIEIGAGYGLGASAEVGPAKVSASAYQDVITFGLKNGSTYTAIKGGAGILARITKKASIGLSTEYEHRFETDSIKDWDKHTTMSTPWDVYNCPKTVKDPLQFSFPLVKPIEGQLSEGLFIGISAEMHIGIGGHFTVGWDVNEFWRIITE